jgi:NitT/TauT family transport system substrate-binding protein
VPNRRPLVAVLAAVVAFALGACNVGSSASPAATPLTVGLGFIPSVQFAPFYLAQQKGYYRDAGVEVTFQNKIDPDLVVLVGQGTIDVGLADGTSVIPAVSQGIPIRYLATVYRAFPSIVFAKLTTSDVQIVEYPDFGQLAAVKQGAVDAATGFINNEPVQLQLSGEPTVVLRVDQAVPLPGPGLITGTKTLSAKRTAVAGFVAATLKAMREIAANPDAGLDAAIVAVPELGKDRPTQKAILTATIDAWTGGGSASDIGAVDRAGWTKSVEFMTGLGLVPKAVTVDQLVDDTLLPKG